jgi:20S proteasome subunit alpha 7
MSGTGYDLSCTTYSAEGRVYQIEYAQKASDIASNALAIQCTDGVVLATEKTLISPMLVPGSTKRIFNVAPGVSLTFSGLLPDAKELVEIARQETQQYKEYYDETIPTRMLAERVASYMHAYTQYWSVRPFGCSVLIAGWQRGRSEVYCVEVSGLVTKFYGAGTGKGRQTVKNELEKINYSEITCRDAIFLAGKALLKAHDENEKAFELEIVVISEETDGLGKEIPKTLLAEVESKGKESISQEQE